MCVGVQVRYLLFFKDLNQNWNVKENFSNEPQVSIFTQIRMMRTLTGLVND